MKYHVVLQVRKHNHECGQVGYGQTMDQRHKTNQRQRHMQMRYEQYRPLVSLGLIILTT